MDLSAYSFEVCQPNATVSRLIQEVMTEVGARIFEPELDHAQAQADADALADLLIYDVSCSEQAPERSAQYLEQGKPVLLCGLRHLRADHEPEADLPALWLDRPFSASALLFQCASLLGVEPSGLLARRGLVDRAEQTQETREEPVRAMPAVHVTTREIVVDEASLLEEQFGLEPGVLGGEPRVLPSIDESTSITVIEDEDALIEELEHVPQESGLFDAFEESAIGGKIVGKVVSAAVDLSNLREISLSPIGVSIQRPDPLSQTMPDRPIPQRPVAAQDTLDAMDATVIGELPLGELSKLAQPEAAPSPLEHTGALPKLDEETSLEIQSFARMLAEAWLRIGLSARVEDRSDRISRIMHALFEQGLEGAARELQRVPAAEGLSGSLSALSLVGLFRTIRDRKLRGRLEVSAYDQAYVLYLEVGTLIEIDTLTGDNDLLMIQILRDYGALDELTCQRLAHEYSVDEFAPPIEMKLRMEGLVSEATLAQARAMRARRLFAHICQARAGSFAFIEIYHGDNHAWPVHELRLGVDELLLELMREAPLETGISEATSRHNLWLDHARMAAVSMNTLTATEREVLRFFKDGGTIPQALTTLPYSADELQQVLNRLKRAELLRQSDMAPFGARTSSEQDAYRSGATSAVPAQAAQNQERTVITDVSSSLREMMRAPQRGAEQQPGAKRPLDETTLEGPTRSSKANQLLPGDADEPTAEHSLDQLLREALGDDELTDDDALLDPDLHTFQRED